MIKTVFILALFLVQSSNDSVELYQKNDYSLTYSEQYELSIYVKYTINQSDINGPFKRKNRFKPDTSIPTLSASPKDYKKSGYDRGHMKPAAVSKGTKQDMTESFLMSNMAPQLPEFNRIGWKKIESEVRSLLKSQDSLIVYTGPVLNGIDEYIGADSVGIPKYFFKAILYGDSTKAYGYLCPHQRLDKDVSKYIVSIDSIEVITGLNLYEGLNEKLEE